MTSFSRSVIAFVPWLFACGITIPGGLPLGTDTPGVGSAAGSGPTAGAAGVAGGAPAAGGVAGGIVGGTAGRGIGTAAGRGPIAGVSGAAGTWAPGRGDSGTGGFAGRWVPSAGIGGVAGGWPPIAGTGAAGVGFVDRDGDGFDAVKDCNDFNPGVHPGARDECCDNQDSDCDGTDAPAGASCRCANPPVRTDRDGDGWSGLDGDCNDQDPSFFPGSLKDVCCDGLDNDCDGRDDPQNTVCSCSTDWDGDGWPAGPFGGMSDCNDKDPRVNPGAIEVCGDGIDNNCDGRIDGPESCTPNDVDGDGYPTLLDCNDFDPGIYPGAPEWCGNRTDDDCDGLIDEKDPDCGDFVDRDGDGYPAIKDCNDWDASVHPSQAEYCGDGIDNNCDGVVDPPEICGAERDWDRDGYPQVKDCNDSDPDVFPGSPYERCCDGVDSNCDGSDAPPGVMCSCGDVKGDADGDGYGVGFSEPGLADCNDQDPTIHPGAVEVCNDHRDNDCDGRIDAADPKCGTRIE